MKKILIIEDDINLAITIRESMKAYGFDLSIIGDGKKGFKHAKCNLYDALIIDYGLPNMCGDDIVQKLRSLDYETPILMLTARNDKQHLSKSLQLGADDYLSKPFSTIELTARLNKLISRPPISRKQTLKIDNLTIDFDKRCISSKTLSLNLTKRELRLLEYLILNKNSLVTRNSLIANVWINKSELSTNTVDCYISNLRKKFNVFGKKQIINTEHGFGYSISF